MDDFKGASTPGEVLSVDLKAESDSGYFNALANTPPQCPSISSDDGTETYHSLECEPLVIEDDQYEEQDDGNPPVASVATAELVEGEVDEPNKKSGYEECAYVPGPLTELEKPLEIVEEEIITSFIIDDTDDDNGENEQRPTVSTYELYIYPNNIWARSFSLENTIIELPEGSEPTESNASSTPDSINAVEAKITDEAMKTPAITPDVEVVGEPGLINPRSELRGSPLVPEKLNGGPRARSFSVESTIIELPEGSEPIESNASSTSDSINTVEAIITDEAMKNPAITPDVEVVGEPGLTNHRSEHTGSPQLPEKLNGGPSVEYSLDDKIINEGPDEVEPPVSSASTTPDSMSTVEAVLTASMAIPTDDNVVIELFTSQSECDDSQELPGNYFEKSLTDAPKKPKRFLGSSSSSTNGEVNGNDDLELFPGQYDSSDIPKCSGRFEGATGIFRDGEVKLEPLHTEKEEHSKPVLMPGIANPGLTQDEVFPTSLEVTTNNCTMHFQGSPSLPAHQELIVETNRESTVPSESSVTREVDGLCNAKPTKEEVFLNHGEGSGIQYNVEISSYRSSSMGKSFIENLMRSPDGLTRDGIPNPCFQGDDAHSITISEANECRRSEVGSPDDSDLDAARAFQVIQWRNNQVGYTGTDLDEIVVFSRAEHSVERGMGSYQKTSDIELGGVEKEPHKEIGNIGNSQEQSSQSKCSICCLRLKKRLLTPGAIFIVFTFMFLIFCIVIRVVFDGPPLEHLQQYGSSPAPNIQ